MDPVNGMEPLPRGCGGKQRYFTRAEAQKARAALRSRIASAQTLKAYHCRNCGGFHVGRDRYAGGRVSKKRRNPFEGAEARYRELAEEWGR